MICSYTSRHKLVGGGQKTIQLLFLEFSPLCFLLLCLFCVYILESEYFTGLELTKCQTDWPVIPRDLPVFQSSVSCFVPPYPDTPPPIFWVGSGGSNLSPLSCKASTLLRGLSSNTILISELKPFTYLFMVLAIKTRAK